MESCPAQLTERIINLASRKAFDIEHLGDQSAIALTNPEEDRPDSVATYAPDITEIVVAPGQEPEPYEPVEGLELPARQTPVLSSEAGLFSLTSSDLQDVRVWREAPIIEIHETVGKNGKPKKRANVSADQACGIRFRHFGRLRQWRESVRRSR